MAKIQWVNDLSGTTNQYASPSLLADNQAGLLLNVSQSQLGNVAHRLGATRFGNQISASNQIRGLHAFEKNDGTYFLHAVHDGNIYRYDAGTWTQQIAQANAGISSTSSVEFANFIGRHYYIGSGSTEYLRWLVDTGGSTLATVVTGTASASSAASTLVATTNIFTPGMVGFVITNTTDATTRTIAAYTDSTTVTVDTAINDTWDGDSLAIYMDGKYLATNGAYMVIAGSTANTRRSYWSGLEAATFDVNTDYAITDTPPTGVASFGNGRPFIVFTQDNYLTVDPTSGATDQVEGFGCVSHRSIGNLKGTLIWLSRDGFYSLAYNQAFPTEVSLPIKNDLTGDAIINKINGTNFAVTASGVIGNKYYCALRDLTATVKGQTLDDCVVEYDYAQNAWRVHTFTRSGLGTVFTDFILSGQRNLYAGSVDDGTIYKMEDIGIYQDQNGSAVSGDVTTVIQTKHYEFGAAQSIEMKNIKKIHFKYKCASGGTITVKYSLNGSTTYTSLPVTLPASPSGQDWDWRYFAFGKETKSISLQLESAADFIIYGLGFEVESLNTEGIDPL